MSYAYILDAFEPFYSGKADRPDPVPRTGSVAHYAGVYWGMIF